MKKKTLFFSCFLFLVVVTVTIYLHHSERRKKEGEKESKSRTFLIIFPGPENKRASSRYLGKRLFSQPAKARDIVYEKIFVELNRRILRRSVSLQVKNWDAWIFFYPSLNSSLRDIKKAFRIHFFVRVFTQSLIHVCLYVTPPLSVKSLPWSYKFTRKKKKIQYIPVAKDATWEEVFFACII